MVEVKDGGLFPEKKEAQYMAQTLAGTLFCCYEGEKDQDELIERPELIEELDYKELCLPWREIEKAKDLITALVTLSK